LTNKTKLMMLKQIEQMEGEELKEDFYYEACLDTLHSMSRKTKEDTGIFISVSELIQEELDEVEVKYNKRVVEEAKNLKFSFVK